MRVFWSLTLIALVVAAPLLLAGPMPNGLGRPRCHGTEAARGHHNKWAFAREANIAHPEDYELDHYIPLCLGGPDSDDNLWLQPWDEAREKDVLEARLCRSVCHGEMTQHQAIIELTARWTKH